MKLLYSKDIISYKKNWIGFIVKAILGMCLSVFLFTNCMGKADVKATSIKSNSSEAKARQYRSDKKAETKARLLY
ncbi:MAG: hypothetical protein ABUK01_14765 [Leptospirales bacterium]